MNYIYINKKVLSSSNAYGVWNTNTKGNKKNDSNQIHFYKVKYIYIKILFKKIITLIIILIIINIKRKEFIIVGYMIFNTTVN